MTLARLLLCTDMDRTVIPNGSSAEHPEARKCFRDFCRLPEVRLVYVTGRHRALVEQAVTEYRLPQPDFAITDVGTKIYRIDAGVWTEIELWEKTIAKNWQGKSHDQLERLLRPLSELTLQEAAKQNTCKLSYYLPLSADKPGVSGWIENRLREAGVTANLIWSIDELEQVALLDVLPMNADKLHGIEFLRHYLEFGLDEVLFAGDSGNDLPVFGSAITS
ncbi:MAG: HAD-IIB family hydrolase, partial [Desulfuromonadaceae bacterium]